MTASARPTPAPTPGRAHNRQRRVTFVIPLLSGGGAQRVVVALAMYWVRDGREVSVVTIGSRDYDSYDLPRGVERLALDLVRPSRHVLESVVLLGRRIHALRGALARLQPDLVVSFLATTNVLSLVATAGSDVPVIVCERTDPRQERLHRSWRLLRRALYPRAAGVVVQTEGVASWARRFCRRVHVIPNFVERPPCIATPGAKIAPFRLVGMGRLDPEKGFDLLIEAFARVAPSHPDWSLTILGEGPERERLERLVARAGLAGRVSLPGRSADPYPALAAAHLFALSSHYEGFPNALLEAMACGLPAVAFDCPSGPAEIITHERSGLLVPPGDVAGLAAALDRLMRDGPERARLGQNAREIGVQLSPERVLAEWGGLLRNFGA